MMDSYDVFVDTGKSSLVQGHKSAALKSHPEATLCKALIRN